MNYFWEMWRIITKSHDTRLHATKRKRSWLSEFTNFTKEKPLLAQCLKKYLLTGLERVAFFMTTFWSLSISEFYMKARMDPLLQPLKKQHTPKANPAGHCREGWDWVSPHRPMASGPWWMFQNPNLTWRREQWPQPPSCFNRQNPQGHPLVV